MNRKDFIKELRRALDTFPFEERENAVSYYEEYLDEAGPENEAEAIKGFGTPASIAADLQAEQVAKAVSVPPKTPKEGAKKVWMVILAIFATPVAIPLAMGIAGLIFGLFITIFSLVFAFGVTTVAAIGAGILSIVLSFGILFSDAITFLYFFGNGIAMIGLGILFGCLTYFLATKLTGGFARLLGRFLHRRKRGA